MKKATLKYLLFAILFSLEITHLNAAWIEGLPFGCFFKAKIFEKDDDNHSISILLEKSLFEIR